MSGQQAPHIKRAQKESLLLRELSTFFLQIMMEEPSLQGLFINRVSLSSDRSLISVFFYTTDGPEAFQKLLGKLILYKPSMRKALATAIPSRYTPQLAFKFDAQYEKQQRIEQLLEKIKKEEEQT